MLRNYAHSLFDNNLTFFAAQLILPPDRLYNNHLKLLAYKISASIYLLIFSTIKKSRTLKLEQDDDLGKLINVRL